MRDEFRPAIEALQKDLGDLERKVSETKATINRLCELAGATAIYSDVGATSQQPAIGSIRADSFYGKVIVTAAREYLEMRKAADLGPATPRDIYAALHKGGFAFDTKNEGNAITGVRNTLRKASQIFHRLPNGEYGLLKWYPNAKAQRQEEDDEKPSGASAEKRKRGRPSKGHGKKRGRPPKPTASAEVVDIGTRGSQESTDESEAADTLKASAA